jgi:DoxX-like protein
MGAVATADRLSAPWTWSGRVMTLIVVLFLLFDAVIHLMNIAPVVQAFAELGMPDSKAMTIGVLELFCLVVYLIPQTAVLGAILLTGYLGGAVAMQTRIGSPLFGLVLFPVYLGLLVWGGLYTREPRLRALFPIRR